MLFLSVYLKIKPLRGNEKSQTSYKKQTRSISRSCSYTELIYYSPWKLQHTFFCMAMHSIVFYFFKLIFHHLKILSSKFAYIYLHVLVLQHFIKRSRQYS